MTTGHPIIDRIDALTPVEPGATIGDYQDHLRALQDAYPELRAELLRLQAERDHARKNWSTFADELSDMVSQRDALLEALKEIVEIGGDGVARPQEARIAMQAVANVEGKE